MGGLVQHHRLMEPLGYIPQAEFEATTIDNARWLGRDRLTKTNGPPRYPGRFRDVDCYPGGADVSVALGQPTLTIRGIRSPPADLSFLSVLRGVPMKILLVEDEGLVRLAFRYMFEALLPDCEVTLSSGPIHARQLLAAGAFDFVFLDVGFGDDERGGLDFLAEVKEDGLESPIIMLSNHDSRHVINEALELGAHSFIKKQDGDPALISNAMGLVFKGGHYLPPVGLTGRGGDVPPGIGRPPESQTVEIKTAASLGLSPRLFEAAHYIAQGLPYKVVASKMGISETVAAEHAAKVYAKLNVRNRQGFMAMLTQNGWQIAIPQRSQVASSEQVRA